MQFNVSQLLREKAGGSRHYVLDPEPPLHRGKADLTRTPDGVLVHFEGNVDMESTTCSRCLAPFGYVVPVEFDEIYIQQVDVATGSAMPPPEDPEAFLIPLNHTIDITEAVRQYSEMAAEMQPLCRPDCPGICPECGTDLNLGDCQCDRGPVDSRWAALAALKRSNG